MDDLKARQEAAEKVAARMMFFLTQFDPAGSIKLVDARQIAEHARIIAFDEFSPKIGP